MSAADEAARAEELAADIRAVDGSHSIGAGALAEALVGRGWQRSQDVEVTNVARDADGDRIIRAKPSQLFDLTAARVEAAAHVISTETEEPVWSAMVIARAALTAALKTMK